MSTFRLLGKASQVFCARSLLIGPYITSDHLRKIHPLRDDMFTVLSLDQLLEVGIRAWVAASVAELRCFQA